MIRIRVTDAAIDVAAELGALERAGGGAVASFTGLVRDDNGVEELFLEHYPVATEKALSDLAAEAIQRWSLAAATVIHRVGAMTPGERIVFVGTAAAHRAAALEACAFLIDRLKTDAPFWKRETRGQDARWVGERDSDRDAADRWKR
ncbi:molybdenum cofactor biosynthesis protein MoaE [Sphingomonas mali]|uniref:molybdenum cofactor biosynthesis protein MoaE n=1 Tax=Sphingomonas mali TaxID=40682 RepID=UPI00082C9D42|nr:molybdenum cofactor biosynthesis protein MoaE [Sphingomonas mali]